MFFPKRECIFLREILYSRKRMCLHEQQCVEWPSPQPRRTPTLFGVASLHRLPSSQIRCSSTWHRFADQQQSLRTSLHEPPRATLLHGRTAGPRTQCADRTRPARADSRHKFHKLIFVTTVCKNSFPHKGAAGCASTYLVYTQSRAAGPCCAASHGTGHRCP